MTIHISLLIVKTVVAMWSVLGSSLLKAAIGLATTSALLSVLMFRLNAPLAAVFELSVCSGLMTVIFVSTISLTRPLTHKEIVAMAKARIKRYWYLPAIVIAVAAGMVFMNVKNTLIVHSASPASEDVRYVLWNMRQLDLIGQIIIIITGALGVVVLFAEEKNGAK